MAVVYALSKSSRSTTTSSTENLTSSGKPRTPRNCGAHFNAGNLVYVPEVHWPLTCEQVMVSERIYGVPVSDSDTEKKTGRYQITGRAGR